MKFFFDNNLSPYLARGLGELSAAEPGVDLVIHLRDKFAGTTLDVEWIAGLTAEGPWCVLSVDKFNKHGGAEREALRKAGHTVFLLHAHWLKHRYWEQAERMVKWWPLILQQASIVSGGAFEVPWKHTSAAKFRAIKF